MVIEALSSQEVVISTMNCVSFHFYILLEPSFRKYTIDIYIDTLSLVYFAEYYAAKT